MAGAGSHPRPQSPFRILIEEVRRYAPELADRLAEARSESELREIACRMFDLSQHVGAQAEQDSSSTRDLPRRLRRFVVENLRTRPTLKDLAKLLGYSEKYCSDLFRAVMGESFSRYVKRLRLEQAVRLLTETDTTFTAIAAALGFSDQFVFSHFFKRVTGRSPREFRIDHARRRLLQTNPQSSRGNR